MPRYFFHVHRDGVRYADEFGQVLTNVDDARRVAQALALDLMNNRFDGAAPWLNARFEVTDENGGTALELSFADILASKSGS